jgi:hypothetical protein
MLSETSENYILVESKKQTHKLTRKEYCRWLCLIEAIHLIGQKASQIGVKLYEYDWIKPLSLQKFIDERQGMMFELIDQHEGTKEKEETCDTSWEPALA